MPIRRWSPAASGESRMTIGGDVSHRPLKQNDSPPAVSDEAASLTVREHAIVVVQHARDVERGTKRGMLPHRLRTAIASMCARAHAEPIGVERLIVMLKTGWSELPEVRRLPRGGGHDAILESVITQVILDFYSDRSRGAAGPRLEPRSHHEHERHP